MSETGKKSLVTKLAEVMGEVDRIPKSGRNNFHNYDYATEADIVAAVRGEMAKRCVMLFSSLEDVTWTEVARKNGGVEKIATLKVKFTFEDGESGEKREFFGMGQGADASDKAIYKAFTGAEKYALLKTFLIPTGDDPEKDDAPPPRRNTSTPAKPAPPKSNAAPLPTPAQVHATSAAAKPSPTEQIAAVAKRFNYDNAAIRDVLGKVVNGKKSAELSPEEVAKVCQYMVTLNTPPEDGRDAPGGPKGMAPPLGAQPPPH